MNVSAHLLLSILALLLAAAPADAQLSVTPEQYGARGDGRSDDFKAFRRAIDDVARAGGGEILGRPGAIYRIEAPLILRGQDNISFRGQGATIMRASNGTAANTFHLIGTRGVSIENWTITSDYDGFLRGSTGSNPNIQLSAGASMPNRRILIRGNRLSNGNHANVTVGYTSVDGLNLKGGIAADGVRIENNSLGRAGVGVFIYKGARNIDVTNNVGSHFSAAGIVADTHAAGTDPDRQLYSVRNLTVSRNELRHIAARGRFAGRGILLKGRILDATISNNLIANVSTASNRETFGIALVRDQSIARQSGQNIRISGNDVRFVHAKAVGAAAAWPLLVDEGWRSLTIDQNHFEGSDRGIRLSNASEWAFTRNRLVALGRSGIVPLEVHFAGRSARAKLIANNKFERDGARATTAIGIMHPEIDDVLVRDNQFVGYSLEVHQRIGR